MNGLRLVAACAIVLATVSIGSAAQITGEYLEARTCDVYTGPCFANGEVGLAGKEAVLAWKVDSGTWAGQDLSGLGAALVLAANDTLGIGGSFVLNPYPIKSVILVDEKATEAQKQALVAFVRSSAPALSSDVVRVESSPFTLVNDHVSGKGLFAAGKLAKIETRALQGGDCVCTNETVFYPPLTKVQNSHAAYTIDLTFEGKGLDRTWNAINRRSAFLATFSK